MARVAIQRLADYIRTGRNLAVHSLSIRLVSSSIHSAQDAEDHWSFTTSAAAAADDEAGRGGEEHRQWGCRDGSVTKTPWGPVRRWVPVDREKDNVRNVTTNNAHRILAGLR